MVFILWCSLVLVLFYHPHVYGKEGILKEGSMLDWFETSREVGASGIDWIRPDPTQDIYYSKTVGSKGSEMWLITKYVHIRNKTTIIYVDIEYKIDLCHEDFSCSLSVYTHKGKAVSIPTTDKSKVKTYLDNNFSLVHVIRAVAGNKTKARFKLSYSGQYITFGINAISVDATVYGMKMFYYYCEGTFINNIYFSNTTSIANQSKTVNGNCSENSISLYNGTEFEALCLQNGTWNLRNGSECLCVKGFEPRQSQGCQPCMADHFKSAASNDNCTKCPKGNQNNDDKTTCKCKEGKYPESPTRGTDTQCFGLPSQVRHLTVENITKSSVILKWNKPLDNKQFNETLEYDVECYSCSSSKSADCKEKYEHAQYNPGQHNLTMTSVSISHLKPGSKYKFKVYSKNMVSRPDGVFWKFKEKSAYTLEEAVPKSNNNNIVIIIPIVVVSSLLLIIILLVMFRKKLNCCRRKNNQNENNVSAAHVQEPDPVITISADTENLDLCDLDPDDDGTYEEPTCEHPYEHPYMGLSSIREPENQYQHLELTTDHVGQTSEPIYA